MTDREHLKSQLTQKEFLQQFQQYKREAIQLK